ncbi:MAG TPA: hypothetical protein VLC49_13655 [Solirubrobacteraceae bacterium]|nr:hypothetical protein [Solirubrobacteraceae bacterium]
MGQIRMGSARGNTVRKLVEYDALRHRLWILGQRCHHGATGTLFAAAAFLALAAESAVDPDPAPRSVFAAVAAGGALMMAHDWKDRAIWFERGRGSQI